MLIFYKNIKAKPEIFIGEQETIKSNQADLRNNQIEILQIHNANSKNIQNQGFRQT